jgi:hypothetical protein
MIFFIDSIGKERRISLIKNRLKNFNAQSNSIIFYSEEEAFNNLEEIYKNGDLLFYHFTLVNPKLMALFTQFKKKFLEKENTVIIEFSGNRSRIDISNKRFLIIPFSLIEKNLNFLVQTYGQEEFNIYIIIYGKDFKKNIAYEINDIINYHLMDLSEEEFNSEFFQKKIEEHLKNLVYLISSKQLILLKKIEEIKSLFLKKEISILDLKNFVYEIINELK